ncbi:histone H1B-like [Harmonia axyridis]|uniref:histone H1B-like n=1 Tax=Harmonia axyridis TaxID=115357 RepID=UPI001E27975D|nr:histone H1B-like [Harmonia axyridis]
MVNNAIKDLKERSGSSLQAIKKFIAPNYKVDSEKLAPFIKKYLKSAVQSGSLVQTKGKGASGSFKLAAGGSTSGSQKKVIKKATFKSKDDLKKSTSASAVVTDKKKKKSTVAKKQAAVTKTKKAVATTEKKSPKAAKSPSKAKKLESGQQEQIGPTTPIQKLNYNLNQEQFEPPAVRSREPTPFSTGAVKKTQRPIKPVATRPAKTRSTSNQEH